MKSICLGLLFVLVAQVFGACGRNGGNSSGAGGASSTTLDDAASAKVKRSVAKVVNATPDKNLPGPKFYKLVCLKSGEPGAEDVASNQIRCTVEAFYKPYRGKDGGFIFNEDWIVPIQNGKLGTPRIAGKYQIRNFMLEDNKRNCTGRHRPGECLPRSLGGELPG